VTFSARYSSRSLYTVFQIIVIEIVLHTASFFRVLDWHVLVEKIGFGMYSVISLFNIVSRH
jgi:hypothetical protein